MDVEMQSAAKIQLKNNIYAEDSSEGEHQVDESSQAQAARNTEVINPSKSKYDKFVEEVKQRES